MVNSDSIAVATFPTPGGRVEYRGDVAIAGVPGHRRAGRRSPSPTPRARRPARLLPTGHVRDAIDGIEVTCVDNGMPVVLALAESFGLTGVRVARAAGRATRRCSSGSTPSAARPAS